MSEENFLDLMQKPGVFGSDIEKVEVLQTHISYVFLTGKYAFKVKKPVNFGFLDFSTLEKRRYYCEEELRLNQRLCPDLYLEVVPITRVNGGLELAGNGKVVEYAVKMQQFPGDRIMKQVLETEGVGVDVIWDICSRLVAFYNDNPSNDEITKYGALDAVKQNIDENFEQTQSKIGITIDKPTFNQLKKVNARFFTENEQVFSQRQQGGFIHDCHGDLHSGNIVLADEVLIFDCIEFNKRFRFCDVASDIGFFAMDLDFLNYPYLSSEFIQCYIEKSGDTTVFSVLNFYKCYRAYVRGKVAGFRLDDPQIQKTDKQEAITAAQAYFDLSAYYCSLMDIELSKKQPLLFLVGGLTGTGKSTVAGKIAVDYGAELVNTDVVRKEMAGIDKYEPHRDAFNTGLYDPKNIDQTYEQVVKKAQEYLEAERNVVLDATFVYQRHRQLAQTLAHHLEIPLIVIECVCNPKIVKQRLEKRMQEKTVSDGRWEIYQQQLKTHDPYETTENYMQFNTENEEKDARMHQFTQLTELVRKVSE